MVQLGWQGISSRTLARANPCDHHANPPSHLVRSVALLVHQLLRIFVNASASHDIYWPYPVKSQLALGAS